MFDHAAQTQPVEERRTDQQRLLRTLIDRVKDASPQHRAQLRGIDSSDVTLDNLHELPSVRKQDLREFYPLNSLCVDRSQLRRIHATSGTSGKPTIVAYTDHDMAVLRRTNARALDASGVIAGTMVHNAYGYGLFTGGLGLHAGIEELKACCLPISGGNTARQAAMIQDLRSEVLLCTPSYAAVIADLFAAQGVDPADIALRAGILGAEPWSEGMREKVEAGLGITALDIYGLCEVQGPGVGFETVNSGGHLFVNEDEFLVECIDPVSGKPCAEGEVGELVFTTLTKEAVPVVRYRTGDLASLQRVNDPEGRTFVTMSRILGRADDMLVIRGVNVFPSEIEAVLLADARVATAYTLVIDERGTMPSLVAVTEPVAGIDRSALDTMLEGLQRQLKERLGVSCKVVFAEPGGLPRTEVGKAVRVQRWKPNAESPFPGVLA
ncbi:phenylacetate-CoA ligase [Antricoccus suffuscus]|uniref:Phenylacetate-coenzyme A ligase n=1 Tax=Antricoccus suffuscus TaxID=1629062 RepID=A0A2T1A6N2_9ACTN|nr:phenylacetate--CoA ligase [Antricoccus suffuscus]PRZ44214.1 phenylacetate-CoA ligase [Antricoccus suffuscus]